METELNSENKNRFKRRAQQEGVRGGQRAAWVKLPCAKKGSRTILQEL